MVGVTIGAALNWLKTGSNNGVLIKSWFQTELQFFTNRIPTPDNPLYKLCPESNETDSRKFV